MCSSETYMHIVVDYFSAFVSVLALVFLVAPLTAFLTSFFALVTFPATVFFTFGLDSFLATGAFLGLVVTFLVPGAFLRAAGAGAAIASKTLGLELPVLERVSRVEEGTVAAIILVENLSSYRSDGALSARRRIKR